MPLYSFCSLLTLQVGTAIITAVFIALACLVSAVNIFDFHNHPDNAFPIPLVLIVGFSVFMIATGVVMFMAAYQESRKLCMSAVVAVVLLTTYWVILCCFSFANRPIDLRRVCVYERCAESFWLANLKYKGVVGGTNATTVEQEETEPATTEPVTTSTETSSTVPEGRRRKKFAPDSNFIDAFFKGNSKYNLDTVQQPLKGRSFSRRDSAYDDDEDEQDHSNDPEEDEGGTGDKDEHEVTSQYVFGLPMIGAIVFFLANFLFFMFTILILWSYAQELKWADYYDPQTTYVVDTA